MTEPSRERIDAALALAKAADTWYGLEATEEQPGWCEESKAMFRAMQAYRRSTAPKLRTSAETLDAIRVEVKQAEERFARRDHGGIIHGHFYDAVKAICAEPSAPEPPAVLGNPLVRIQWQCSRCGWGFFGPLQETCPGCGAHHYWSGSVAPDCKPWPGYPCAPAPGVVAAPLPLEGSDPLHPTGRCTCGGEGRCDLCKAHPDPEDCPECDGLRGRLRDIYHLTITYGNDAHAVAALKRIRRATMPGATGHGA